MLSAMLRTIAAHDLLRRGDRVLVAVSGGPDSMALLHALWEVRERLGIALEVVGVDHGLRAEARAELDLVEARAAELGLPFHSLAADVAAHRRAGGVSLQDAARRARLGALAALANERGAARVALGHQADDQAETILYRIVRGTGLRGLRGIPYRRAPFVRPLLDVRRAEILRYLRRRSIPFVEDPSNADPRFARARIRHRILPLLAQENPRVAEALLALAESARSGGDDPTAELPDGLPALPARAAAVVRRLRARGGSGAVDVAGGRRIQVSYGELRVAPGGRGRSPTAKADPSAPLVIARPGRYRFSGGAMEIRIDDSRSADRPGGAASDFDAECITWPLVVRARRPGDRMRPRGGRGSRKLSDLMIDAKIARRERALLPVVTTADGDVLYVPGLRPSEQGRPSESTRRRLFVSFTAPPSR
jgi:tRNA(Ile)-lysidine synthase